MTRSTIKRLTKPLNEPEREFQRHMKAALCSHQNESLTIAGRNLFDDEASSSYNTGAKPQMPPKTLHDHYHPNSSGFQNPITFPTEQPGRIVDSRNIWLIQNTCTFQGLRNEDPLHHVKHYLSIVDNIQADGAIRDTSRLRFFHFSLKGKVAEWLDRIPPTQIVTWDQLVSRFLDHFFLVGCIATLRDLILRFKQGDDKPIKSAWIQGWNQIEEYIQYQDDLWDDMSPPMNISAILEEMQPTFRGHLKRAFNQISYLKTHTREVGLKNLYLICDYWGGSHEADECKQTNRTEQVCLSEGDIYDDPSLMSIYQNDDTPPWGNSKRKEKGEDGPE
ncbi:DNA-directed DNA polymerase [Tanacetum coccineum]